MKAEGKRLLHSIENWAKRPIFRLEFDSRIAFGVVCLNSETGALGFGLNSAEVHVGGEVEH